MSDFRDFARLIFPGQAIPYRPNPPDFPPDVQSILDQVAEGTGIPSAWLDATAGLIVDGLAGLQCLWSLHDVGGSTQITMDLGLYGIPGELSGYASGPQSSSGLQGELYNLIAERMVDGGALKRKFGGDESRVEINWSEGRVLDRVKRPDTDQFVTVRTLKLGKWLRKQKASKELLHAFETRQLLELGWKISTHPFDVLTMSFNRPWSSCMRPGSDYDYQYGLLTDMAAGSAILFFYEPNNTTPAGRLTLRPGLDPDGNPCMFSSRTVYGWGPFGMNQPITEDALDRLLQSAGINLAAYNGDVCSAGAQGRALTRNVYCNVAHEGCNQDDEEYDRAYLRLGNAPWAPTTLDIGDLRSVSEDWKGEVECTFDEPTKIEINVANAVSEIIANAELDKEDDVRTLFGYIENVAQAANEMASAWFYREYPSIHDMSAAIGGGTTSELNRGVLLYIRGRLVSALNEEPVMLVAFSSAWRDLHTQTRKFIKRNVVDVYRYIEMTRSGGSWYASWFPRPPPDVCQSLRLSPDPNDVERGCLFLPPEGDPQQLASADLLEPYMARTVVAIHFPKYVENAYNEEAKTYEDGEHPLEDDASLIVILPEETYDWENFARQTH